MEIQAAFYDGFLTVSTAKNNRIFNVGYVTHAIATGDYDILSTFFSVQELDEVKEEAAELLELCFSSKQGKDKLSAYIKCEEKFKLGKGCLLSESKPVINNDDTITIVETYWLTSLSSLLLIDMIFAIQHNVPILKCPICNRFFIANNHGIQYCENIYKDGKTCRQIGANKQFKEKVKADAALALYEKKYQAIYYKRKKATDNEALKELDALIAFYHDARSKYKKDEISSEEFISMLEQ